MTAILGSVLFAVPPRASRSTDMSAGHPHHATARIFAGAACSAGSPQTLEPNATSLPARITATAEPASGLSTRAAFQAPTQVMSVTDRRGGAPEGSAIAMICSALRQFAGGVELPVAVGVTGGTVGVTGGTVRVGRREGTGADAVVAVGGGRRLRVVELDAAVIEGRVVRTGAVVGALVVAGACPVVGPVLGSTVVDADVSVGGGFWREAAELGCVRRGGAELEGGGLLVPDREDADADGAGVDALVRPPADGDAAVCCAPEWQPSVSASSSSAAASAALRSVSRALIDVEDIGPGDRASPTGRPEGTSEAAGWGAGWLGAVGVDE